MKTRGLLFLSLLVLLLALGVFLSAVPTQAAITQVFWVSQAGGLDTNPCTSVDPCQTIQPAVDKAVGTLAATVNVLPGTYPPFTIPITGHLAISATAAIIDGGHSSAPVIWVNAPSSSPTVTIDGVTVQNGNGTGIVISGTTAAQVLVKNSVIQNNTGSLGGGIYNNNGSVTIERSLLQNNQATSGGAVYNDSGATTVISQTAVLTNTATSAGGGAFNAGMLDVVNSTVSANSGSGLVNSHTLRLYNATISLNTATSGGGGVANSSGTASLANTILAGNNGPAASPDCSGTLTSGGYNILGSSTGCTGLTNGVNGDQITNPQLQPLADNGGFSPTQAITTQSPAYNNGNPTGCMYGTILLTEDQRGQPRQNGPRCDVGAFELQAIFPLYLPLVMR